MNEYYSSNNSELDLLIKEVKHELKAMILKRKDLILKLGNELEKVVANPESTCEEIKIVLHEEIAEHILSSRDIERYAPDKWKKKTKPQKNDKLSFLTKTEEQEKEESRKIAIDTHGNPVDEPKSKADTTRSYVKESICSLQPQQKPTNVENNTINLHSCPNCKAPLLENQRIEHEKDIKIKRLQDEIQQVYHDLNIKRSENAGLQTQLDHLKEKLQVMYENNGSVLSASNTYHQLQSSSPIVDLEFTLQYEEVRRYVSSRLKISGVLGALWFNCRLDKRTFRIISAYPGSILEQKAMANKEDNRNE
jgi:uncharacterized protein YbaR (Trm112 family)